MADATSVAFIVNLLLPDDSPQTLAAISEDISETLDAVGLVVTAVAPYERESLQTDTQLEFDL